MSRKLHLKKKEMELYLGIKNPKTGKAKLRLSSQVSGRVHLEVLPSTWKGTDVSVCVRVFVMCVRANIL